MIFAYGYVCRVFKHNICGDHPRVREGMSDSTDPLPPEFFVNPRCPSIQAVAKATATKVPPSETVKESMEVVAADRHIL